MKMHNFDLLYDKNYFGNSLKVTHKVEKVLSYCHIKNGLVLPHRKNAAVDCGGIITEENRYIENSGLHGSWGGYYRVNEEEIVKSKETVIYLGLMCGIWGHCITDNIRRMWFLKEKIRAERFGNCRIVYVPYGNFQFSENFKSMLKILEIDSSNFVPITRPTRFREIILPDECFYTLDGNTRFFTQEYVNLINRIKEYGEQHFNKLDFNKIYFTYARCSKFKQIGEQKLELFFSSQGYKIIAPEEYSFLEQLNMLLNCKSLATTIGSCSHNLVFMKDGAEVLLIPRANYLTGYQLALDDVTELDIKYISSDFSILANQKAPWNGPFYYYVSDNLNRYFQSSNGSADVERSNLTDFNIYLKLGLARNQLLSDSAYSDYYNNVLPNCMNKLKTKMRWRKLYNFFRKPLSLYVMLRNDVLNRFLRRNFR